MKLLKLLFITSAVLLLAACANTGKVFSDFDPDQQFDNYKKFSWSGNEPGLSSGTYPISAMTKSKMQDSIKAVLEERGFVFTDVPSGADFLVSFTLGARDKISTRRETEYIVNPRSWRWGRIYYPYYFPEVLPVTREKTVFFTEGSIAIDVFDAKEGRPVWHSSGSKRLTRKELAGSVDKQRETASALLEGFPPQ